MVTALRGRTGDKEMRFSRMTPTGGCLAWVTQPARLSKTPSAI